MFTKLQELMEWLGGAMPLLPAVIVVLFVVLASRLVKRLLGGKVGGSTAGRYRVQITQLALGITGVIAFIVVLPVDQVLRGQLLSLYGIVLTATIALASTTFVGNVMAGMMLKAVKNFRTGDFIKIKDNFGKVTERGLLSTEIQTEDRDLVTLPNLYLVTNPVKVVRSSGTIISAEVSLGYDVPHEAIERHLLAAAEEVGLQDPFVHTRDLGNFAVNYRLAGLLSETQHLISTRSRLRNAMLDHLHLGGIEIVSPTFMNTRSLSAESQFIPQVSQTTPAATDGIAENLAFDKANEMENLDMLKREHEKMTEEIESLEDNGKDNFKDVDKQDIDDRIEFLKTRRARLEHLIQVKENQINKKDDNSG